MTARSLIDVSARRHRLEQRSKAVDLSTSDAPPAPNTRPTDNGIVKATEVLSPRYSPADDAFSDNNRNVRRLSNVSLSKWSMPDDHSDDDEVRPVPPPIQSLRVEVHSAETPTAARPLPSADPVKPQAPQEPVYAKPHRPSNDAKQAAENVPTTKKWDIPSDSDSDSEQKRPKVPSKSQEIVVDESQEVTVAAPRILNGGPNELEPTNVGIYETVEVQSPPPLPAPKVEEEVVEIVPDDAEETGLVKAVVQTQTVTEMVESRVPDFDGEDFAQYLQDEDHFVNFIFTLGRKTEKTTETLGRKREPNDFAFIENPFLQEVQYKTVPVQKKTVKQTVTTLVRKDKSLDGAATIARGRSIADYATLSRSLQNFAFTDSKMGSTIDDDDGDGVNGGGARRGGASELGVSRGGGGGGFGTMPSKHRLGYGSVVSMDQLAAQCRAANAAGGDAAAPGSSATASRQRFQKAKRGQQRTQSDAGYDRRVYESVDDPLSGGSSSTGGATTTPQQASASLPPTSSPAAGTGRAASVQQQPTKEPSKKGKSLFSGLKKFFRRSKTADGSSKRNGREEEQEDYQEFAPF